MIKIKSYGDSLQETGKRHGIFSIIVVSIEFHNKYWVVFGYQMVFKWSSVERWTTQPLNITWQPKAVQDLILTIFLEMILYTVAYISLMLGTPHKQRYPEILSRRALIIQSTGRARRGWRVDHLSFARGLGWPGQDTNGTELREIFKTKCTVISRDQQNNFQKLMSSEFLSNIQYISWYQNFKKSIYLSIIRIKEFK